MRGDYGERPDAVSGAPARATPWHSMRNTRMPSIAAASAGSSGIGSSDLLEARRGRVRRRRGSRATAPWSLLATDQPAGAELGVARSRTSDGVSLGRARRRDALGLREPDREVVDHRRRAVERGADRGHLAGERPRTCAPSRARRRRTPAGARPRTAASAKIASSGAEPRDRLASSRAGGPAAAIPASSAPSAETSSRTWTGTAAWRNVPQVVATGNSEARDEEREQAHEQDRPQRPGRGPATAGRAGR